MKSIYAHGLLKRSGDITETAVAKPRVLIPYSRQDSEFDSAKAQWACSAKRHVNRQPFRSSTAPTRAGTDYLYSRRLLRRR